VDVLPLLGEHEEVVFSIKQEKYRLPINIEPAIITTTG